MKVKKLKLNMLKVNSFVTTLDAKTKGTIAGGAQWTTRDPNFTKNCGGDPEPLPDTWLCPSVNRCPSVNGYTCPIDDGPKPEGPLPKF